MNTAPKPFFIGWSQKLPKALKPFLAVASLAIVLGFAGMALVAGASQEDPDGGRFRFDWGPQELAGIIIGGPYPALWVTEGSERVPAGQAILLNGNGKVGVQDRTRALHDKAVMVRGVVMQRGSLDMLQLQGGERGLSTLDGEPSSAVPTIEDLGRWRLSGEICDGRCLVGAMRPGEGLAHKACANLCISGGQPPVFVTATPVEGETFFLLTGPKGEAVADDILRRTAETVVLEGQIARIGNLSVLRILRIVAGDS